MNRKPNVEDGLCPVCGKKYLRMSPDAINGDHYYHVKEKLMGINHYPPSGLCVDNPK